MIEENTKEGKFIKPTIKENNSSDKGKTVSQNTPPIVSNEEQKQLNDLLSTNVKQINPKLLKVNTNIIEEIFSENLDTIVQEIEK